MSLVSAVGRGRGSIGRNPNCDFRSTPVHRDHPFYGRAWIRLSLLSCRTKRICTLFRPLWHHRLEPVDGNKGWFPTICIRSTLFEPKDRVTRRVSCPGLTTG